MAQFLKEQIQECIINAAMEVFAQKGFRNTTVAEIGRKAGVSTGNIYRYYENKEVLFRETVTDGFAERFIELIRSKVASLAGVEDIRHLDAGAPYHLASEQLLAFCAENRLRIVIVLGNSQGTRYENFADEVVAMLSQLAIAHFRFSRPDLRVTEAMRFNVDQVYRNAVVATVNILNRFDRIPAIRQAIKGYSKYHLAGLKGLFE